MSSPTPRKRFTVIASSEGIEKAESALIRLGFESQSSFAKSQLLARSTVTNFFNFKPIQLDTFKRVCDGLRIEWKEILDPNGTLEVLKQNRSGQPGVPERSVSTVSQREEWVHVVSRQVTVVNQQNEVEIVIVLEGDITSIDADFKSTLEVCLKSYAGCRIQVTNLQPGSIRITIKGDQQGMERLIEQFASGEFTDVDGFPIRNIHLLSQELPAEPEESDSWNKWNFIQEILRNPGENRELQNVDLSDADLSGVILIGANLTGADLSGADLSGVILIGANLRNANLRNALLSASQFLGSNLTAATLTGACIQDWNINSATQLNDVICKYVYLKYGWSNQEGKDLLSDRYPSDPDRIFAPGEFSEFFQEVETVDLIFGGGIDWKALLQSFQELRPQYYDNNLFIRSIEKKSGGAFVIRLEVPADADKGAIESRVKELYERNLQQLKAQYAAQLQAKDGELTTYETWLDGERDRSTDLIGIVKTMADKEATNLNLHFNAPVTGVAGNVVGNQNVYAAPEKQSLAAAAAEIQTLLKQLEQTNPTATEAEQKAFVTAAIPATLRQRAAGALQAGGKTVIAEVLENPYVNVAIDVVECWRDAEV